MLKAPAWTADAFGDATTAKQGTAMDIRLRGALLALTLGPPLAAPAFAQADVCGAPISASKDIAGNVVNLAGNAAHRVLLLM